MVTEKALDLNSKGGNGYESCGRIRERNSHGLLDPGEAAIAPSQAYILGSVALSETPQLHDVLSEDVSQLNTCIVIPEKHCVQGNIRFYKSSQV